MRKFDKKGHIKKANLLIEERYFKTKRILTEDNEVDSEWDIVMNTGHADEYMDKTHFAIHKPTNSLVNSWDYSDIIPVKPTPPTDKTNKRLVTMYKNKLEDYKEEYKYIIDNFKASKDEYFYNDIEDIVGHNMDKFKKGDFAIVSKDNLSKNNIDLNNVKIFRGQR